MALTYKHTDQACILCGARDIPTVEICRTDRESLCLPTLHGIR
jgi:hypothetical protein